MTLFRREKTGFALVISILLLGFVVLLILGLSSIVAIESQVSSTNKTMAEARQNAILGIMVALGELNKHAADDQRITATSSILYTEPISGNPTNPLETQRDQRKAQTAAYWQSLQPHWTGVWDSRLPQDEQKPVWLVSGNEALNYMIGGDSYPTGYYEPDSSTASTDRIRFVEDYTDASSPNEVHTGVEVPLVRLPSADGSGAGGYAYWVSDEGVKASVSVQNEAITEKSSFPIVADDYDPVLSVAQRFAPELFIAEETGVAASVTPAELSLLADAFTPEQWDMLLFFSDPERTGASQLDGRIHDFTTSSIGLLTDVRNGGLKADLTQYLEAGSGLSDTASIIDPEKFNSTSVFAGHNPDAFYGTSGFPASTNNLPTWDDLRSWYQLTAPSNGVMPPKTIGEGVGPRPVISQIWLHYGFSYDAGSGRMRYHMMPCIGLWNPTDVDLTPSDYTITVKYETCMRNIRVTSNAGAEYSDHFDAADPERENFKYHSFIVGGNSEAGARTNGATTVFVSLRELGQGDDGTWIFKINDYDLKAGEVALFTPATTEAFKPEGNELINDFSSTFQETIYVDLPVSLDPLPTMTDAASVGINGFPRMYMDSNGTLTDFVYPGAGVPEDFLTVTLSNQSGVADIEDSYYFSNAWTSELSNTGNQSFLGSRGGRSSQPSASKWRALYTNSDFVNQPAGRFREMNAALVPIVPYGRIYQINLHEDPYNQAQGHRALRLFANYSPMSANQTLNPIDADRGVYGNSTQADRLLSHDNVNMWAYALNSTDQAFYDPGTGRTTGVILDSDKATEANYYPISHIRRSEENLFSLAALQHVPLSMGVAHPSYAIGNSEAPPHISRHVATGYDFNIFGEGDYPNNSQNEHIDLSFLLNESLFDSFFLSGRTSADLMLDTHPFLIADTTVDEAALLDFEGGAAHQFINGAFNVNSTSVRAWEALLASTFGVQLSSNGAENPENTAPIPRKLNPSAGPLLMTDDPNSSEQRTFGAIPEWDSNFTLKPYFDGTRFLTQDQIRILAERIVDEVRARGPFTSVSDFVNRELIDAGTTPEEGLTGLKGALQRALDLSGLNGGPNYLYDGEGLTRDPHFLWPSHELMSNSKAVMSNKTPYLYLEPEHRAGAPEGEWGLQAAHTAGLITQADLLQLIGPRLTARSDTFIIHSYGEVRDRYSDQVVAKAGINAEVQRSVVTDPVTGLQSREFRIVNYEYNDDF